jgi:hypothetical protein
MICLPALRSSSGEAGLNFQLPALSKRSAACGELVEPSKGSPAHLSVGQSLPAFRLAGLPAIGGAEVNLPYQLSTALLFTCSNALLASGQPGWQKCGMGLLFLILQKYDCTCFHDK